MLSNCSQKDWDRTKVIGPTSRWRLTDQAQIKKRNCIRSRSKIRTGKQTRSKDRDITNPLLAVFFFSSLRIKADCGLLTHTSVMLRLIGKQIFETNCQAKPFVGFVVNCFIVFLFEKRVDSTSSHLQLISWHVLYLYFSL